MCDAATVQYFWIRDISIESNFTLWTTAMRDNWNISLSHHLVNLVPYQRKFVEKYHEWMSDRDILEQTASEPLSIQEEYDMQRTWLEDPNKCTFIILSCGTGSELERMVGDVNLFMHDVEDRLNAEIEIMIASPLHRRKGYGRDSVLLMMRYGIVNLHIRRFFAKISYSNDQSIKLFTSLGFKEINYVPAFQEYELEFVCSEENKATILELTKDAIQEHYEAND